jgi:predicted RNA-binding Zn-ribbon protein involved in translation (DUF1610 family)
MATDYLSGTRISDYDLTLAIPGDVESVRSRLVKSLQTIGYKVISEQPLQAKRGAQGSARWECSLNVLDYPTTLTIALKQTNNVAVIATFNYETKSYMCMTKGDRQTVTREAEAIAALATERLALSACPACGTQVTDESHFCRRCGAPLVTDLPELEVLRLTRNTRSSYHSIFLAVVALFLVALTVLPALMIGLWKPLIWAGIPLGTYGLFLLLQGVWRLHQTLNPKRVSTTMRTASLVPASITTALPAAPSNRSITEGTTELLLINNDRRVAEPVPRKDPNTAEIDDDRLM